MFFFSSYKATIQYFFSIAIFMAVCMGCKDFDDPRTDVTSLVKLAFKSKIRQYDTLVYVTKIETLDGHKQKLVDTFLQKTDRFYLLPLNPQANQSTFYIYINPNKDSTTTMPDLRDMLTIHYTKKTNFISTKFGAQQQYLLKKVTIQSSIFAKAKICHAQLNRRVAEANIQLFF